MILGNKLGITNQVELARAEEKISKQRAKQLFDSEAFNQVIDWNAVDKDEYLSAMQRSVMKDLEIKALLQAALTNKIDDRALFMKGIDVSYYYEDYSEFKTEEL